MFFFLLFNAFSSFCDIHIEQNKGKFFLPENSCDLVEVYSSNFDVFLIFDRKHPQFNIELNRESLHAPEGSFSIKMKSNSKTFFLKNREKNDSLTFSYIEANTIDECLMHAKSKEKSLTNENNFQQFKGKNDFSQSFINENVELIELFKSFVDKETKIPVDKPLDEEFDMSPFEEKNIEFLHESYVIYFHKCDGVVADIRNSNSIDLTKNPLIDFGNEKGKIVLKNSENKTTKVIFSSVEMKNCKERIAMDASHGEFSVLNPKKTKGRRNLSLREGMNTCVWLTSPYDSSCQYSSSFDDKEGSLSIIKTNKTILAQITVSKLEISTGVSISLAPINEKESTSPILIPFAKNKELKIYENPSFSLEYFDDYEINVNQRIVITTLYELTSFVVHENNCLFAVSEYGVESLKFSSTDSKGAMINSLGSITISCNAVVHLSIFSASNSSDVCSLIVASTRHNFYFSAVKQGNKAYKERNLTLAVPSDVCLWISSPQKIAFNEDIEGSIGSNQKNIYQRNSSLVIALHMISNQTFGKYAVNATSEASNENPVNVMISNFTTQIFTNQTVRRDYFVHFPTAVCSSSSEDLDQDAMFCIIVLISAFIILVFYAAIAACFGPKCSKRCDKQFLCVASKFRCCIPFQFNNVRKFCQSCCRDCCAVEQDHVIPDPNIAPEDGHTVEISPTQIQSTPQYNLDSFDDDSTNMVYSYLDPEATA